MTELEELMHDAEEARVLLASANRKKWKDLLTTELAKIESRMDVLKVSASSEKNSTAVKASTQSYNSVIRNYSWDQSDKFLKLYLDLSGIQNLPKDKITCDFDKQNLSFKVFDLNGKNYELTIILAHKISPERSHFKVKTDMVVIFAAKETASTWEAVTAEDLRRELAKKNKSKPDLDSNKEDPTSGLMGLMKQMYDDGDDDMKRMLNKTWYESQQKKQGGGDDPDGLPNLDI